MVAGDFTDNGDGTYTVDISGQIETAITEVDSVNFYDESGDTRYETIQLEESFTIEKFENSDGEEVQQASFDTSSEPQDDTNYITQEEWDELAAKNEELIEKYEESQNQDDGVLGGGGGLFDGFDVSGRAVAIVAAALVGIGVLSK